MLLKKIIRKMTMFRILKMIRMKKFKLKTKKKLKSKRSKVRKKSKMTLFKRSLRNNPMKKLTRKSKPLLMIPL